MEDEKKIEEEKIEENVLAEEVLNVPKEEAKDSSDSVKASAFAKTSADKSTDEVKKESRKFFKRTPKHENREEEYLFGWKRCMADFENYKKRQKENQKSIGEYIKEDWALQILPVIDNFRSATEHIPLEQKEVPWVVGIMYIQKQLEDVLKENGVSEVFVKVGDEFDPNLHEAIADNEVKEGEEKVLKNKIKKVVVRGYKLGEKVIRPARVIVE
jgi:molecular chaperone GrpE